MNGEPTNICRLSDRCSYLAPPVRCLAGAFRDSLLENPLTPGRVTGNARESSASVSRAENDDQGSWAVIDYGSKAARIAAVLTAFATPPWGNSAQRIWIYGVGLLLDGLRSRAATLLLQNPFWGSLYLSGHGSERAK